MEHFDDNGIEHISRKLDVGDYQLEGHPEISVDRKQNLIEVVNNVQEDHERFRRELLRAKEAGTHLVILVEHSNRIRSIEDVSKWQNPRIRVSPMAMTGERLARILTTMSEKYGVEWQFCDKEHTGERIMEILRNGTR